MVQSKDNRDLANLGADLTGTDMNKGYATQSKLKDYSPIHWVEENYLLPSQTIPSDDNEEALTGAAATASLISPPTNNSASTNLS